MNVFTATGRIGAKDAVTRNTQSGRQVTGWSLAVEKGWGDNKQTIWLDCSLWGERGVKLAASLVRGTQIAVSGELGTREHDGKTYITLDVRDVTLLGGKADRPAAAPTTQDHADDVPF